MPLSELDQEKTREVLEEFRTYFYITNEEIDDPDIELVYEGWAGELTYENRIKEAILEQAKGTVKEKAVILVSIATYRLSHTLPFLYTLLETIDFTPPSFLLTFPRNPALFSGEFQALYSRLETALKEHCTEIQHLTQIVTGRVPHFTLPNYGPVHKYSMAISHYLKELATVIALL